jgi:23S rRNA (cytidine1920-2'-O)/16S rRNA (cytidine1409-2'-O)-methyltransferase
MKDRLDRIVVERCGIPSREQARRLIMAGKVRVGGNVVDKPGTAVAADAEVEVEREDSFVSRGGTKLEGGLEAFGVDVTSRDVIDIGASTGGFTDCVLRRGARRVVAVDVGYGQFDWRLRQDERVTLLERTNARNLAASDLPFRPDLAVIDVSFISLRLILPAVVRVLREGGEVVALVKPQFEVGRGQVGKGGVVRDPELHESAVRAVCEAARNLGFEVVAECRSPLLGPKGNVEFLVHLRLAPSPAAPQP